MYFVGEHDGFEQAYGPDGDPEPTPEEQRLPAPHEPPGAHSKKEPVAPPGSSRPDGQYHDGCLAIRCVVSL